MDLSESERRRLFQQYASERRSAHVPGYKLELGADITRHHPDGTGDEALLWLARFPEDAAESRIEEELAALRSRGWHAEWKLHDFDEPADLKTRLEARGLASHHEEALMILDVAATEPREFSESDIIIKRASSKELEEIATLAEEVWECRLPWLPESLRRMTDPVGGTASVYCARTADRVIGSGWIDFHRNSTFAQLCGGAMSSAYRGRGIYSRLFERRVEECRERGVPFIAVDAAPMSRPILERRGFRFICRTFPMRTRPYEPLG